MTQPLANRLAEYTSTLRFEDLPQPVVHEAKRRFIDSLGTAALCGPSSADEQRSSVLCRGPRPRRGGW